jgi:hypothetical protein
MEQFFKESTSLYEDFDYNFDAPHVIAASHIEFIHAKIDRMLLSAQSQEVDGFEEDELNTSKNANRDKYRKHLGGRRNKKEQRQQLRRQLREKNERRRNKKIEKPLDPHGWTEYLNFARSAANGADQALKVSKKIDEMKEFYRYKGSSHRDLGANVLCRIEDLSALVVGLSTAGSIPAALSLIHLYLRTHYSQPMTLKLKSWIEKLLCDGYDCAQDVISNAKKMLDVQGAKESYEQIKDFRRLFKDWRKHKSSPLAQKLTNVVNILVTFGFLPDWEKDPLKCGEFQLFQAKAWDFQKDSISFLDMTIDTISYFLERGFAAFVHKDISLLLHEDNEAAEDEAEYSLLLSALPLL